MTKAPPKPRVAAAPAPAVTETLLAALTAQEAGASLDIALSKALKASHLTDPAHRRQVVRDLNELNRRRARLSWHLSQEKVRITPHNLFLAWNAFESRPEPKGTRISELDRALLESFAARQFDDKKMPEAARLECPPAFERPLREALGSAFVTEMVASLKPAPVDLRVNLIKATRDDARKKLKAEGIDAHPTPFSPWALRAQPGANITPTAAFQEGLIEFQDEGSQLAALLVDARAGLQVMDFCAGTGGKTLALGASMKNRGHLVACDPSAVRLARAKLRLKRAGVENAERKELPATDDKWMKKHHARFDRVLVDAPCSGTGSWRRNPDVRWSTHASNIAELTALQDAILARAAKFVKPDGRLIYATCSLLRTENDDRVAKFLENHPDFEAIDARDIWRELAKADWPSGDERVLRLSPAKHNTDGFFAAVLHRVPAKR
jgi:16S rRNA (cytosine967-C5)-methyltransferase